MIARTTGGHQLTGRLSIGKLTVEVVWRLADDRFVFICGRDTGLVGVGVGVTGRPEAGRLLGAAVIAGLGEAGCFFFRHKENINTVIYKNLWPGLPFYSCPVNSIVKFIKYA